MKHFLLITGMHRSGTSFLARGLNLGGVYLGHLESLISHDWKFFEDNIRGHWENRKALEINEKILNLNDGSWDNIPEKLNFNEEINQQIQEFVKSLRENPSFASGFKDPRAIICFDAWKKNIPKNFVIVGIFRHPLKVAESLKIRNDFSYEKSLELWKNYNNKLLQLLDSYPGFLLNFDWPKEKLLSEVKLILKKLGLNSKVNLQEWYTDELFHSDKTFNSKYTLDDQIKSLHSNLEKISDKNSKIKIKKNIISSQDFGKVVSSLLSDIQNQGIYFRKIQENLQKQITKSQEDFKQEEKNLSELKSKLASLQTEKDSLQTEKDSLQTEKDSLQTEKDSLQTEKDSLQTELESLIPEKDSQLEITQAELAELQNALHSRDADFENLQRAILFKIPFKIARWLDRTFPPDSKSGEFIRLTRVGSSTAKNQGIKVLLQAILEKNRKQKFVSGKTTQLSIKPKIKLTPRTIYGITDISVDQKITRIY